jgi:hypothetical protein
MSSSSLSPASTSSAGALFFTHDATRDANGEPITMSPMAHEFRWERQHDARATMWTHVDCQVATVKAEPEPERALFDYPSDSPSAAAAAAADREPVSSLAPSSFSTNRILTLPPLHRHSRSSALSQTQPPGTAPFSLPAIPASTQPSTEQDSRHVPPLLVNGVPTHPHLTGSNDQFQLEQAALQRYSSNHVSLNNYVARLRTPHSPVYSVTDLAVHHDLPQSFPQPPCTAPQRTASQPAITSALADPELAAYIRLQNNYMQMRQETVDSPMASSSPLPAVVSPEEAASAIAQMLAGDSAPSSGHRVTFDSEFGLLSGGTMYGSEDIWLTPALVDDSPQSEFFTSPFGDPPLTEFDYMPTPLSVPIGMSPHIMTSPEMLAGARDSFDNPLFGDISDSKLLYTITPEPAIDPSFVSSPSASMLHYFPPTPSTPAFQHDDHSPTPSSSTSAANRRRAQPTGTRKNVTPETLMPVDAPVQQRKYVTPSQTSRKDVPATFARKRARSQAFGDDDELAADDAASRAKSLSEEEQRAIESKRMQNTMAARRSRKRKLEYQRELEDTIELERREKDAWKQHALVLEALLLERGGMAPPRPAL